MCRYDRECGMQLEHSGASIVRALVVAGCLLTISVPRTARAQIEWHVSVKFVLGPNGELPGSLSDADCSDLACSAVSCEREVQDKIDYGNAVLAKLGRGISVRVIEWVDDVVLPEPRFSCCEGGANAGGTCTAASDCPDNGPGDPGTCAPVDSWFNAPSSACTYTAINDLAESDPQSMAWNDHAINIYVTNACMGGYSGRAPGRGVIIGQTQRGASVRWLHEIGHFFSLCHTHGGCAGCSSEGDPDCMANTIRDADEWDTPDTIAQQVFGVTGYGDPALTCDQREDILDVFYNIMSYHQDHERIFACDLSLPDAQCSEVPPPDLCRHRLTPDQLDLMADVSNTMRRHVATGCLIFVDAAANPADLLGVPACAAAVGYCDPNGAIVCCDLDGDGRINDPCGAPGPRPRPDLDGNSTRPYSTVRSALQQAIEGDVLLIRGGFYDESFVIQNHITLRASRSDAVIGASAF